MQPGIIVLIVTGILILLFYVVLITVCYKKCPPDKILVIYGKVGTDKEGKARTAVCIHGGAAFVWPIVQSYSYLDLAPIPVTADLKKDLSCETIRPDAAVEFIVAISTEPDVMKNAAERLFFLKREEIAELAKQILLSQMRTVLEESTSEGKTLGRDEFLNAVAGGAEGKLAEIGLRLLYAGGRVPESLL